MGRKSDYTRKVKPRLNEVVDLISKGQPEYKVYELLGVSESSWFDYKNKYPELPEAIKKGQALQLELVKQSLMKGAVGYEFEEVKEVVTVGRDGKKVLKKEITKKHYAPSPTLIIFYLLNKSNGEFRDKKELLLSGAVNNPFENLTTDELKKLIEDD